MSGLVVLDRKPVDDHDGKSGASIETGRLEDGTAVFVKRAAVERDLGALLTGSARRELELFEAGVFACMPEGVDAALIAIEERDGDIVTVSRDVSGGMLRWDRMLSADEVELIFERIGRMHAAFADAPPAGLTALEDRISLFTPRRLESMSVANPELAAAIARGLELLADLVPPEIAAALARCYEDPRPLAKALSAAGTTLLHGDFWFVNIALEERNLVLIDWGLATLGPPAVDYITFCVGAMSNVAMDRAALLDAARRACGRFADDTVFAAASFWALMELGWNKALDTVDHPDPAKRATERADLDFWIGEARHALATGAIA